MGDDTVIQREEALSRRDRKARRGQMLNPDTKQSDLLKMRFHDDDAVTFSVVPQRALRSLREIFLIRSNALFSSFFHRSITIEPQDRYFLVAAFYPKALFGRSSSTGSIANTRTCVASQSSTSAGSRDGGLRVGLSQVTHIVWNQCFVAKA